MIIETTAPIAIEDLKKHFEDKETSYLVDYEKSELKGEKLLTYLSNLDLPCDLKNITPDLLKDYFHSTSLVNCFLPLNLIVPLNSIIPTNLLNHQIY